jgi:hypothetical protein
MSCDLTIVAPDGSAVLKDTANNTISTTPIASGATENITAPNATAVLKNTANTTLSTTNIRSNASQDISAPDAIAVLKDTAGNTILSENIPSNVSEDITAPDGTINVINSASAPIQTETVRSGQTKSATIGNVSWTDSDGSAESTPYGDAIVCTAQIKTLNNKSIFAASNDTVTYTADADQVGTITSHTDDGSSGTFTVTINATPVSLPYSIALNDVVVIVRTITTGAGFFRQTGTYT